MTYSPRPEVLKWLKHRNRFSPYFIYSVNHLVDNYHIAWNEDMVTKFGSIRKGAAIRYGIHTKACLVGVTPFDISYGRPSAEEFEFMLQVRKQNIAGVKTLDLSTLELVT